MTPTQWIMIGFMVTPFLTVIGLDIYMALNGIPGDTYSELFQKAIRNSYLFQVGLGVMLAHLTWPTTDNQLPASWIITGLLTIGLTCLSFDIYNWIRPFTNGVALTFNMYPIILLLGGILLGRLIWAQQMIR